MFSVIWRPVNHSKMKAEMEGVRDRTTGVFVPRKKTNEERIASAEEDIRRREEYPLTGTSFVSEEREEKRIAYPNPTRPAALRVLRGTRNEPQKNWGRRGAGSSPNEVHICPYGIPFGDKLLRERGQKRLGIPFGDKFRSANRKKTNSSRRKKHGGAAAGCISKAEMGARGISIFKVQRKKWQGCSKNHLIAV